MKGLRIGKGEGGSGLALAAKQEAEQPTGWRRSLVRIVRIDARQRCESAGKAADEFWG
jgi:hypothetical protein